MLDFISSRGYRDCEGTTRRDFLKIGTLGAGALTLPGLLASAAERFGDTEALIDAPIRFTFRQLGVRGASLERHRAFASCCLWRRRHRPRAL